jgi:hypothetical protein
MAKAFWEAGARRLHAATAVTGRRLAGNSEVDSDARGLNDGRLDANSREIVHREQVGIHSFFSCSFYEGYIPDGSGPAAPRV